MATRKKTVQTIDGMDGGQEEAMQKDAVSLITYDAEQLHARSDKTDEGTTAEDTDGEVRSAVRQIVKRYDFCNRNPTLIHTRLRAGPMVDILMEIDADTVKAAWNEYKKCDSRGDQESFLLLLGELVGGLGRTYYHVVHVNLDD